MAIEGPFLRLYREHVNLAPNARVYFLDTGKRAGLNAQALGFICAALFSLLILSLQPNDRFVSALRSKRS